MRYAAMALCCSRFRSSGSFLTAVACHDGQKGTRVYDLLLALLAISVLTVGSALAAGPPDRSRLIGIYGEDDRRIIEDMGPPWSAIGRVNRRTGGFCSGALIAPDKVLTAVHCLWNNRTSSWMQPDGLFFLPGYRMGSYLATQPVIAIRRDPNVVMDGRGHPRDFDMDWAILTLKGAIPLSKDLQSIPPASIKEITAIRQGQALVRAGYSQDRPHLPTSAACSLLGRISARQIRHDCDGTKGDSGSPILIKTEAGWRVLGLHVAVGERGGRIFRCRRPAPRISTRVGNLFFLCPAGKIWGCNQQKRLKLPKENTR